MTVLLQADLVTGAMAIMILSTIKRKVPLWAFLLDWFIAFFGNLAGALFHAGLLVFYTDIYTEAMVTGSAAAATAKAGPAINFRENLLRGMGCNLLVCLAVYQASLAKDVISKIVAAWFPIFVFISAGFEHVVASMFIIPEGLMQGSPVTVGRYIWNAMIREYLGAKTRSAQTFANVELMMPHSNTPHPLARPCLAGFLGNILGAALLVLPLLYLYGGDEHDPLRSSPSGETLPITNGNHSPGYTKDVESGGTRSN